MIEIDTDHAGLGVAARRAGGGVEPDRGIALRRERDGELLRDLAAGEQRELNVEDRVGQLGQRLRAVLEHVRGDELVDRADRGAERVRRDLGDLGDVAVSRGGGRL